ncbi:MAG: hypothetical protein Q8865_09800 [Bacillota bacterium]|nr:hypothetical protein [Bacillota bacterium]
MSIIVNSIPLSLNSDEKDVLEKAVKAIQIPSAQVRSVYIRKKSVDSRRKNHIQIIYSVGVELENEALEREIVSKLSSPNIVFLESESDNSIEQHITRTKIKRPVIIGFGPAGMFAALCLARAGFHPIIIERGDDIDTRASSVQTFWSGGKLDPESNVQFGEGGAGTFSDGKLNTGIKASLIRNVLNTFYEFGADKDILINARPHIGTDVLRNVVKNLRKKIIDLGGEIHFRTRLEEIIIKNSKVEALKLSGGAIFEADVVMLAIGHSARDTYNMLYRKGFKLEQKPFSAGVRLEQLQETVDSALYGKFAGHPALPPGEYKFSYREGDRGVYSFCMCPGGYVVAASSEEQSVVTNGMSYKSRSGSNANSAIVVSVLPSDFADNHPLSGISFQQELERNAFIAGGNNYYAPVQISEDFVNNKISNNFKDVQPTYSIGTSFYDLNQMLPTFISDMIKKGLYSFDKQLRGFNSLGGLLTGVETRTSSPVRITRGSDMQSVNIIGAYPIGEGAGYAGGITSSAVDGIKAAKEIISHFTVD